MSQCRLPQANRRATPPVAIRSPGRAPAKLRMLAAARRSLGCNAHLASRPCEVSSRHPATPRAGTKQIYLTCPTYLARGKRQGRTSGLRTLVGVTREHAIGWLLSRISQTWEGNIVKQRPRHHSPSDQGEAADFGLLRWLLTRTESSRPWGKGRERLEYPLGPSGWRERKQGHGDAQHERLDVHARQRTFRRDHHP